jgi:hypothetical protein
VVPPRGRRRSLPDRRYLVADRDRRPPDHAAAGRHAAEAGLGDAAVLRRGAGAGGRRRGHRARGRRRGRWSSPGPGRRRCAPSTAITSASSTPTSSSIPGYYFTGDGARRDEDGYYWITGRIDDVLNVSGHRWAPPRSSPRWCCTRPSPRPPWSATRTTSRARASTPMSRRWPGSSPRRAEEGTGQAGARRDRPDRHRRHHPVGARAAEDPLRQDHAPHPAQDRRQRGRQPRRHLDAGRPDRGR